MPRLIGVIFCSCEVKRIYISVVRLRFFCSIGVYLLGDALLPDRDEVHLPSVPVADLERDAHCPLLDSTSLRDNAGTPSCEALAKLIAPGVSAQAVQELKVQEQFWDCVFSHHLCQLGAVSGAEAKREAGFDVRTFVHLTH